MKERHLQIINLVNEKEKVSVQELSELLKLSMVLSARTWRSWSPRDS